MPLYEFRCPNCGRVIEKISTMAESNIYALCENCNTGAERIFSPFSFSFGWRLTDACHERFGPREEYERDV